MQKLVKGVASFEVVEQVLYGNSGAVEYRNATQDLGVTENNRVCHAIFLLLPLNDTPDARLLREGQAPRPKPSLPRQLRRTQEHPAIQGPRRANGRPPLARAR